MTETKIHNAVCKYLRLQYPKVIFTSESSGIRTTIGLAKQLKMQRSESGLPDLMILEPKNGFHGLCIEIKKDKNQVYTKTGKLKKNKHISKQREVLERLSEKGYSAVFGCGFDGCIDIIDSYLK